jgi:SAM-dependent methyltransferase
MDDSDAQLYDAWFESPWGRYAWAAESGLLRPRLADVDGRLVLDVGCGTGRSSALLRDLGARVVGIDPDPGMLDLVGDRADAVLRAYGEGLPFGDSAFDVTVAVTVLEFVRDPARVLAEMSRVTRSPGTIVVGALNPRSPWGLWHRDELKGPPWTSARFLSAAELLRLGSAHGTVSLDEGLRVPGRLPGLDIWGRTAEWLGRYVRIPGAFRVLTIEWR